MNLISRFKKNKISVKQPQEYYCSNDDCIEEVALFNPMNHLMTDEASNKYADFFCINCIIEGRTNV
jgi:hypothetical protein